MKRKQSLKEYISEINSFDVTSKEINEELEDYQVLHCWGKYYAEHFGEPTANKILETIDSLYKSENLFLRNAIENEFFPVLTLNLEVDKILEIIRKIPQDLRTEYIKVLLETTKKTKYDSIIYNCNWSFFVYLLCVNKAGKILTKNSYESQNQYEYSKIEKTSLYKTVYQVNPFIGSVPFVLFMIMRFVVELIQN